MSLFRLQNISCLLLCGPIRRPRCTGLKDSLIWSFLDRSLWLTSEAFVVFVIESNLLMTNRPRSSAKNARARHKLMYTGCRNSAYCSSECRLVSWQEGHKELCRGMTSNKPLKPIPPLNLPVPRMSLEKERAARKMNLVSK
ncbi:hypothetical protein K438DRAFT_56303 [Mycena galopus ATCC 62051]|nr:hypothetical protein K438DRAFT_56303 [Mycena galopus ATCC 62051]